MVRQRYRIDILITVLTIFCIVSSCNRTDPDPDIVPIESETITIFSINDPHGQINNFDKISHIVTNAELEGPVIVVSAGDIFSGNPVVDFSDPRGYPMIDLMNKCGFDVAVLGNHEFDYGQEVLKDRIEQAEFEFILANADMSGSILDQPEPYITISSGEIDVTFLGAVQTSYTSGKYIPATHPFRVEGIEFYPIEDIINDYASLKSDLSADLVVLLSHLGTSKDYSMANNYPYMDVIIGGHSHANVNTTVNGIPIYQCGSYLHNLGKITLTVKNGVLESHEFDLINLDTYSQSDQTVTALIDEYNDLPLLNEVIGNNLTYINKNSGLGCFYTDILRLATDADISFQNGGGLRSDLDEGEITVREIFEIDPFNNYTHIYSMKVEDIKRFLVETGAGFHYSGVTITDDGYGRISIKTSSGIELSDDTVLKLAVNDYIAALHQDYFVNPTLTGLTTAEEIIDYLKNNQTPIDYSGCSRYYAY